MPVREELHLPIGLPLIRLETEGQLPKARYDLRLSPGHPWLGRNLVPCFPTFMKTEPKTPQEN